MHSGNFHFLKEKFDEFYAQARKAENFLKDDSESCAIYCRKSLEEMVVWMFETDRQLETIHEDEDSTLNTLIHKPSFRRLIGQNLFIDINAIRRAGNLAVHNNKNKKTSNKDAYTCIINLHAFAQWLVSYYGKTIYNEPFNVQKVHGKVNDEVAAIAEANIVETSIEATEEGISYKSPSEELTRTLYIDLLLKEAGWIVGEQNVKAEYLLKHSINSLDRADYVLLGNNGKALAVVEAKRTTIDGRDKGLKQAKRYADALEKEFGTRPIIFTSNGFEHFIWDDLNYPYRSIQGFYSKEDLETLINRRVIKKLLASQQVDLNIAGRYYQIESIQRAKEELEKGNRDLLFIMATGSGKTRTAAALVDVLTKTNHVKRILFLADRTPLISQAKNAFNDYLPQLSSVNLTKDKTSDQVRMVFSTYQTMINCIDNDFIEGRKLFTPGYFDLVIFDEVHRSIYQKYKAIFNYFDAIRLGLTATPKAETHKDTYELFQLETGIPTFSYELNKAVEDQFLTPPMAMMVPLKFPRQGIKYADLSDEDKLKYEETFAANEEYMPEEIDSSALNEWLFNENTVNKVLQLLLENGLKVHNGDTIGKTIIFAKNQAHARFIELCFNKLRPDYKGNFLQVITHSSDQPEAAIDSFKQANKMPQIVVSVDMLDTGIDVPDILNLVFFKSVKSSSKYWQMIGRGTRLCPNIFGVGEDKESFYIFDYCGNIEFFGDNPQGIEPSATISISQRIFQLKIKLAITLELLVEDDELNEFRHQLLDGLHTEILKLDRGSFINKPHLREIDTFSDRNYWNNLSEDKFRLLDKHILALIVNSDTDFDARKFDMLVYKLMDSYLSTDKSITNLVSAVKTTARELLKQTTIPHVAVKKELLKQILNDTFWQNIDLKAMENVRLEIRALMKFLEKDKQPQIYTNFTDELTGDITIHNILSVVNEPNDYQKRVETFIKRHKNFLVISKIKNNEPITKDELELIKKLLFDEEPETASHLEEALDGKSFILFIRSIVGLDIKAAKEIFAEFINRPDISAEQMNFMDTLINYLMQNGTIDKVKLFDRPFTDINQNGVLGVFEEKDAVKIINIIDVYNQSIA